MKIQIDVTQEDIDTGIKEDAEACAIAKTLKRNGYKHVTVGNDSITFYYKGIDWYATPPSIASEFISNFDEGELVKPFSFELIAITEEERYADESE